MAMVHTGRVRGWTGRSALSPRLTPFRPNDRAFLDHLKDVHAEGAEEPEGCSWAPLLPLLPLCETVLFGALSRTGRGWEQTAQRRKSRRRAAWVRVAVSRRPPVRV